MCPTPKSNTELWDAVYATDPEFTKKVAMRGGFTSIGGYYLVRKATERWGAYGSTWGLRECKYGYDCSADGAILALYLEAKFEYPGGSFDIASDIPYAPKDECRKKLRTDCIKKALSYLGFSADVFMGKFDDDRYVADMRRLHGGKVKAKTQPVAPAPQPKSLNAQIHAAGEEKGLNHADISTLAKRLYSNDNGEWIKSMAELSKDQAMDLLKYLKTTDVEQLQSDMFPADE